MPIAFIGNQNCVTQKKKMGSKNVKKDRKLFKIMPVTA